MDNKELVSIEMQFYSEDDYFKRMLYGESKTISEHIYLGDDYDKVRKVYSINNEHSRCTTPIFIQVSEYGNLLYLCSHKK
ncbi:MAG: Rpn family recombination-promoting nuclease/putative transposase [Bacteroidales bacterium]|nr:Rpn family recombination-promoting nuclease/putative transposase [Bacteroidales bacterium]